LGIIKRTVGTRNQYVFSTLYKTLVRPIIEYATPVWSPYLAKDIVALEKVQRRASRLALQQKRGEMPYEERCCLLKWPTLEKRREYLSLVECFKSIHGLNGLVFEIFFEYPKDNRTRANHKYKLYLKAAKINCYKYSFFVRIVSKWNNLPSEIVESNCPQQPTNRLRKLMDT
jgi:hypothetical protein